MIFITHNDIKNLLTDYEIFDHYKKVADWYNGYLFGSEVIYNPWSVLSFIPVSRSAWPAILFSPGSVSDR